MTDDDTTSRDEQPRRSRRNEWADAMALYAHWHANALRRGLVGDVDAATARAERARHWTAFVSACEGYTAQQTRRSLDRRMPMADT